MTDRAAQPERSPRPITSMREFTALYLPETFAATDAERPDWWPDV